MHVNIKTLVQVHMLHGRLDVLVERALGVVLAVAALLSIGSISISLLVLAPWAALVHGDATAHEHSNGPARPLLVPFRTQHNIVPVPAEVVVHRLRNPTRRDRYVCMMLYGLEVIYFAQSLLGK